MSDALTQIETAFRDRLKAVVTEAASVLGPEDLPVRERDLPALLVDMGAERAPDYLGGEMGERTVRRFLQVDVLVACDAAAKEFRAQSRSLANAVRAALADPDAFGLPLDDVTCVGVQPQEYDSEKGRQGGYHLAFLVTCMSRENTPGVLEARS